MKAKKITIDGLHEVFTDSAPGSTLKPWMRITMKRWITITITNEKGEEHKIQCGGSLILGSGLKLEIEKP